MSDCGPEAIEPPPSRVTVRDGTIADAPTIAEFNLAMALETEGLRLDAATVHSGVRNLFLDAARGRYFVATIDGRVVGCLMVTREWSDWRNGDLWWIQSVYVAKEHRRSGAFRMMYAHVRDAARSANVRGLRLYVERHNDRAKHTYASLGMQMTEYDIMQETIG